MFAIFSAEIIHYFLEFSQVKSTKEKCYNDQWITKGKSSTYVTLWEFYKQTMYIV